MSTLYFSLPGHIDEDGDYLGAVILRYRHLITDKHDYLFNFLDFDFEYLKSLLLSYFEDFDEKGLVFNTKSKDKNLHQIKECLKTLHPIYDVYQIVYTEINDGIRMHLNALLCEAGHMKENSLSKDKYFSLLQNLYLGNYQNFEEEYREGHYEKYLSYSLLDNDYGSIFPLLFEARDTINKMLFWILDYSEPKLSVALSINQRATLYSDIFVNDWNAFLTLTKEYKFKAKRHLPANLDFMTIGEVNEQVEFYSRVNNLHNSTDDTIYPKELDLIISNIQKDEEDSLTETYVISNIRELLLMEIMDMISESIAVKKCRFCGRYFIVENLKSEYCNRIIEGETKPCSVIGSTRTYQHKSKTDIPLMLHQRAYKTHFARIKNGKGKKRMSQNDFQMWAIEAKQKLDAVRASELPLDEFEKWLKK